MEQSRTLEKRDRAKPIPLFEKFREFSRNPVENTGLSIYEGVHSWVLFFFSPFAANVSDQLFYIFHCFIVCYNYECSSGRQRITVQAVNAAQYPTYLIKFSQLMLLFPVSHLAHTMLSLCSSESVLLLI